MADVETPNRNAAARPSLAAASEPDDLSSHVHRQTIGYLGLALPLGLWLIAGLRPTEGLPRWSLLGSISAYYYSGAVAAFVGILVAIGIFLFTYRGYANEYHLRDRVAAIVAGAAAILVASFPTAAPYSLPAPSWWTTATGAVHYVAAITLLCAFAFYCLVLFPMTKVPEGEPLPSDKVVRNRIYRVCGAAIVAGILWAAGASLVHAPIFWPETLAVVSFAVSWLVKGRVDKTAAALGAAVVGSPAPDR